MESVPLYVSALAAIINGSLNQPGRVIVLFAILLVVWLKLRRVRKEQMQTGGLEFEELPEPAVLALGLGRE